MHVPTYEDAALSWRRKEPWLTAIPGPLDTNCLVLSKKQYRPTVACGGRQVRLARVGYIAAGGVIPPEASCLRHGCDDLRCVNPDHLVPGDDLANAGDRRDRGRNGVGWRDGRWCANGHDTSIGGVYLPRSGGRQCAACARDRARKHGPRQTERRRQRREAERAGADGGASV